MKPRKDSADRGAGSGCMARLVRCYSSSDEAICGGHSEEVADDGSGQPQADLGQLAGTQLAHGYESPQVGLPHQAVTEQRNKLAELSGFGEFDKP